MTTKPRKLSHLSSPPHQADANREVHSDRALPQFVSRSGRLLLVVVVMLGPGVVVASVAIGRESLIRATMVNFWLFAHLSSNSCVFSNLSQTSYIFKCLHKFAPRLSVVQSRPANILLFATLVLDVLFYFVSTLDFFIYK